MNLRGSMKWGLIIFIFVSSYTFQQSVINAQPVDLAGEKYEEDRRLPRHSLLCGILDIVSLAPKHITNWLHTKSLHELFCNQINHWKPYPQRPHRPHRPHRPNKPHRPHKPNYPHKPNHPHRPHHPHGRPHYSTTLKPTLNTENIENTSAIFTTEESVNNYTETTPHISSTYPSTDNESEENQTKDSTQTTHMPQNDYNEIGSTVFTEESKITTYSTEINTENGIISTTVSNTKTDTTYLPERTTKKEIVTTDAPTNYTTTAKASSIEQESSEEKSESIEVHSSETEKQDNAQEPDTETTDSTVIPHDNTESANINDDEEAAESTTGIPHKSTYKPNYSTTTISSEKSTMIPQFPAESEAINSEEDMNHLTTANPQEPNYEPDVTSNATSSSKPTTTPKSTTHAVPTQKSTAIPEVTTEDDATTLTPTYATDSEEVHTENDENVPTTFVPDVPTYKPDDTTHGVPTQKTTATPEVTAADYTTTVAPTHASESDEIDSEEDVNVPTTFTPDEPTYKPDVTTHGVPTQKTTATPEVTTEDAATTVAPTHDTESKEVGSEEDVNVPTTFAPEEPTYNPDVTTNAVHTHESTGSPKVTTEEAITTAAPTHASESEEVSSEEDVNVATTFAPEEPTYKPDVTTHAVPTQKPTATPGVTTEDDTTTVEPTHATESKEVDSEEDVNVPTTADPAEPTYKPDVTTHVVPTHESTGSPKFTIEEAITTETSTHASESNEISTEEDVNVPTTAVPEKPAYTPDVTTHAVPTQKPTATPGVTTEDDTTTVAPTHATESKEVDSEEDVNVPTTAVPAEPTYKPDVTTHAVPTQKPTATPKVTTEDVNTTVAPAHASESEEVDSKEDVNVPTTFAPEEPTYKPDVTAHAVPTQKPTATPGVTTEDDTTTVAPAHASESEKVDSKEDVNVPTTFAPEEPTYKPDVTTHAVPTQKPTATPGVTTEDDTTTVAPAHASESEEVDSKEDVNVPTTFAPEEPTYKPDVTTHAVPTQKPTATPGVTTEDDTTTVAPTHATESKEVDSEEDVNVPTTAVPAEPTYKPDVTTHAVPTQKPTATPGVTTEHVITTVAPTHASESEEVSTEEDVNVPTTFAPEEPTYKPDVTTHAVPTQKPTATPGVTTEDVITTVAPTHASESEEVDSKENVNVPTTFAPEEPTYKPDVTTHAVPTQKPTATPKVTTEDVITTVAPTHASESEEVDSKEDVNVPTTFAPEEPTYKPDVTTHAVPTQKPTATPGVTTEDDTTTVAPTHASESEEVDSKEDVNVPTTFAPEEPTYKPDVTTHAVPTQKPTATPGVTTEDDTTTVAPTHATESKEVDSEEDVNVPTTAVPAEPTYKPDVTTHAVPTQKPTATPGVTTEDVITTVAPTHASESEEVDSKENVNVPTTFAPEEPTYKPDVTTHAVPTQKPTATPGVTTEDDTTTVAPTHATESKEVDSEEDVNVPTTAVPAEPTYKPDVTTHAVPTQKPTATPGVTTEDDTTTVAPAHASESEEVDSKEDVNVPTTFAPEEPTYKPDVTTHAVPTQKPTATPGVTTEDDTTTVAPTHATESKEVDSEEDVNVPTTAVPAEPTYKPDVTTHAVPTQKPTATPGVTTEHVITTVAPTHASESEEVSTEEDVNVPTTFAPEEPTYKPDVTTHAVPTQKPTATPGVTTEDVITTVAPTHASESEEVDSKENVNVPTTFAPEEPTYKPDVTTHAVPTQKPTATPKVTTEDVITTVAPTHASESEEVDSKEDVNVPTTFAPEEPTYKPDVTTHAVPTQKPTATPGVTTEDDTTTVAPTHATESKEVDSEEDVNVPTTVVPEKPAYTPDVTTHAVPTQKPTASPEVTTEDVITTDAPTHASESEEVDSKENVNVPTTFAPEEPTYKPDVTTHAVPTQKPTATPGVTTEDDTTTVAPTHATESKEVDSEEDVNVPTTAVPAEPTYKPDVTTHVVPTHESTGSPKFTTEEAITTETSTHASESKEISTEEDVNVPTTAVPEKPAYTPDVTTHAVPTQKPTATPGVTTEDDATTVAPTHDTESKEVSTEEDVNVPTTFAPEEPTYKPDVTTHAVPTQKPTATPEVTTEDVITTVAPTHASESEEVDSKEDVNVPTTFAPEEPTYKPDVTTHAVPTQKPTATPGITTEDDTTTVAPTHDTESKEVSNEEDVNVPTTFAPEEPTYKPDVTTHAVPTQKPTATPEVTTEDVITTVAPTHASESEEVDSKENVNVPTTFAPEEPTYKPDVTTHAVPTQKPTATPGVTTEDDTTTVSPTHATESKEVDSEEDVNVPTTFAPEEPTYKPDVTTHAVPTQKPTATPEVTTEDVITTVAPTHASESEEVDGKEDVNVPTTFAPEEPTYKPDVTTHAVPTQKPTATPGITTEDDTTTVAPTHDTESKEVSNEEDINVPTTFAPEEPTYKPDVTTHAVPTQKPTAAPEVTTEDVITTVAPTHASESEEVDSKENVNVPTTFAPEEPTYKPDVTTHAVPTQKPTATPGVTTEDDTTTVSPTHATESKEVDSEEDVNVPTTFAPEEPTYKPDVTTHAVPTQKPTATPEVTTEDVITTVAPTHASESEEVDGKEDVNVPTTFAPEEPTYKPDVTTHAVPTQKPAATPGVTTEGDTTTIAATHASDSEEVGSEEDVNVPTTFAPEEPTYKPDVTTHAVPTQKPTATPEVTTEDVITTVAPTHASESEEVDSKEDVNVPTTFTPEEPTYKPDVTTHGVPTQKTTATPEVTTEDVVTTVAPTHDTESKEVGSEEDVNVPTTFAPEEPTYKPDVTTHAVPTQKPTATPEVTTEDVITTVAPTHASDSEEVGSEEDVNVPTTFAPEEPTYKPDVTTHAVPTQKPTATPGVTTEDDTTTVAPTHATESKEVDSEEDVNVPTTAVPEEPTYKPDVTTSAVPTQKPTATPEVTTEDVVTTVAPTTTVSQGTTHVPEISSTSTSPQRPSTTIETSTENKFATATSTVKPLPESSSEEDFSSSEELDKNDSSFSSTTTSSTMASSTAANVTNAPDSREGDDTISSAVPTFSSSTLSTVSEDHKETTTSVTQKATRIPEVTTNKVVSPPSTTSSPTHSSTSKENCKYYGNTKICTDEDIDIEYVDESD